MMITRLVVKVTVMVIIKNKKKKKDKLGNTKDYPFLVQYATNIAPWLTIHSNS